MTNGYLPWWIEAGVVFVILVAVVALVFWIGTWIGKQICPPPRSHKPISASQIRKNPEPGLHAMFDSLEPDKCDSATQKPSDPDVGASINLYGEPHHVKFGQWVEVGPDDDVRLALRSLWAKPKMTETELDCAHCGGNECMECAY